MLLHVNNKWISQISGLANEDPGFITQLVLGLRPAVFAPREEVKAISLTIVHRGVAMYGGKIVRRGCAFGKDMLLNAPYLRERYTAHALTYLEVFFITRDRLLHLTGKLPPIFRGKGKVVET